MAHRVQAAAGQSNVQVPNGQSISGAGTLRNDGTTRATGETADLTAKEFSQIPANYFPTYLVDLGNLPDGADAVVTQAADVADPAVLTSAQVGAAPTQAQFNALQTDVANLRATVLALTTNFRGSGRPMA